MKKLLLMALCGVLSLSVVSGAYAAKEAVKPPQMEWSFDGVFGTYDRAALQRGFLVYKQVCSACHAMSKLSYRNLAEMGYSDEEVKAIASQYSVMDGPNDEGEMFERPARPSDPFANPYANKKQAIYANNGAYPPDMSLLAKARKDGPNYIYGLLTGYEDPPEGKELMQGQYWNKYMPGHIIAMARPLMDEQVPYEDGAPQTVSQYSKDLAHFLMWSAEPHMETRKKTGVMVFLFLLVFTGLMYAVKRKIWRDVH